MQLVHSVGDEHEPQVDSQSIVTFRLSNKAVVLPSLVHEVTLPPSECVPVGQAVHELEELSK